MEAQGYKKLVEALRHCSDPYRIDCNGCAYEPIYRCREKMMRDAADAIEALNRLLDQNTQRCEALRKQLREAHESYERHLNELEAQLPKQGEWILTNDEIETIRIHMNAIKEQLCNQYRHREAEAYQTIVDKLAKMEVQDGQ